MLEICHSEPNDRGPKCTYSIPQVAGFSDQGLARLLWSFATLAHHPHVALLAPLEAQVRFFPKPLPPHA